MLYIVFKKKQFGFWGNMLYNIKCDCMRLKQATAKAYIQVKLATNIGNKERKKAK